MTFAGTGLTNEMHDFMAIDEVELGEREDPFRVERPAGTRSRSQTTS